jgi:hypothetical protein
MTAPLALSLLLLLAPAQEPRPSAEEPAPRSPETTAEKPPAPAE